MTDPVSAGPPLSDDEIRELTMLLARYVEHELNQWDALKVRVPKCGAAYIDIALEKRPNIDESVYVEIWPPRPDQS